jgi:ABC-type Na+ efflux pump permease subunit
MRLKTMMSERVRIINALLWKDAKNLTLYLAFCFVVTVWALLFIIGNGLITGNSSDSLDGIIAYTPFIITMFSAVVMITTLSEETRENTLESLLCTPLELREILCSKILFVIVFPYLISMVLMLPLLAVLGKPVVSLIVVYQMIVDLPVALLVVTSATTAWLVIPGKLHWILNLFCSACFIVSLFFYFNVGAPYGLSTNLPVSPLVTTILLVLSLSLVYAMFEKIGTIEKNDVI